MQLSSSEGIAYPSTGSHAISIEWKYSRFNFAELLMRVNDLYVTNGVSMNIEDVYRFFYDKKDTPCPITDKLIMGGYQQRSGGYIRTARKRGKVVDHRQALPSQWWHLIECYYPYRIKIGHPTFPATVVCGELLMWMAEVSGAVDQTELTALVDEILTNGVRDKGRILNRGKWNTKIKNLCFDAIERAVKQSGETSLLPRAST